MLFRYFHSLSSSSSSSSSSSTWCPTSHFRTSWKIHQGRRRTVLRPMKTGLSSDVLEIIRGMQRYLENRLTLYKSSLYFVALAFVCFPYLLLSHLPPYIYKYSYVSRFVVPNPSQTTVDVQIGSKHNFFYQDDFHTSYASFFTKLSPELQVAKSAMEMNRCFFIHLGIAINMHPFALQCAFRRLATIAMENAGTISILYFLNHILTCVTSIICTLMALYA